MVVVICATVQRKRKAKGERQELSGAKTGALVRPLLAWFRQNARDLPWRRTRDPYAIWISEIMLQQTQVKTVIPYWRRWMRGLPTVQSLARARRERVLKLWEGLGYYTRANNLQKAARIIVDRHGGRFPQKYDDLVALPGIGRYTAGAVLSIAFNEPAPVLDGNVIRVLTRLFGIAENPREKKTGARLWGLAQTLVRQAATLSLFHEPTCSHLNQALMELGATICTSRQPKCSLCPVRKHCIAFRENRVVKLPNLDQQAALTERRFVAFVAESRGRFPVRQRPAGVVNARLWEFPNVEVDGCRSNSRQLARDLFGSPPLVIEPLRQIRHTITRFRITLEVVRVEFAGRKLRTIPNGRWCSLAELRKLAFPSAHRQIADRLCAVGIADRCNARVGRASTMRSSTTEDRSSRAGPSVASPQQPYN
ncbi:MAG: A/G-specific adenine glycosylase [Verrucomicrobia bacterium]|nr:MAG: A/G-specific adenine glycosylase [Verrucomicrobiota bacterium]